MRIAPLLVAFVLVAACGGGSGSGSNNQGSTGGTQPSSGGGAALGKAVNVHATLTGGPTAGSWDVTSDTPCSFLHDQNGTAWGMQFTNSSASSSQLSTFSIGVMSEGANAGKFTVQAGVGDVTTNPLYVSTTLATSPTLGGSGTVTVQDGGATAKINVDVTTKEGYGIKGTVQCNKVDRLSA